MRDSRAAIQSPAAPATISVHEVIDSARTRPAHLLLALLCAGTLLVDGYNLAVLGYLGPEIAKAWDVPAAQLGSIFSASLAGNLVGFTVLSALAYRFGPKRIAVVSVGLFGLAEILAALSTTVPLLLTFRFLAGIGLAGGISTAVAIGGEYFPLRWRSTGVTYIYIGFTAGQMAAGAVSRWLLAGGFSWRAPVIVGGTAAVLLSFVLARWMPDSPEYLVNRAKRPDRAARILNWISPGSAPPGSVLAASVGRRSKGSVRLLFADGLQVTTLLFWLAIVMNSIVVSSVSSWLTTMLVESGLAHGTAIQTAVIVSGAGIAAGLVVGPLMDRFGPFRVMIGLLAVGASAAFVLGFVMSHAILLWISVAAFCLTLCTSGITKGSSALAVFVYPPAILSAGVGWTLGVGRLGAIVGPLAVGAALQVGWAPGNVFKAMSLPLLVGSVALLVASLRYARRRADAAQEARPTTLEVR